MSLEWWEHGIIWISFLFVGFDIGWFLARKKFRPRDLPPQQDKIVWRKSPEHVLRQKKINKATAGRPRLGRVKILPTSRAQRRMDGG